jgi:folylpolyglutamate synthase/dihydropteroate synthase
LAPRTPVAAHQGAAAALAAARAAAGPEGAVLCCGSLYLAGELLELVEGRLPVAMPAERL